MRKVKLKIKVFLRITGDLLTGIYFKFPKTGHSVDFQHAISITQEVKPSETFDNKIYNLIRASGKINQYIILPNQIFSFWNIIGNPEGQFKKGRSIINGEMSEEAGGGLCQVSGIIYYVALVTGLEVLERYNHSMDIYTDATRFTPLGTDATVVYGYKDLRLRNNLGIPIRFCIQVAGNSISAHLQAAEMVQEKKLSFSKGIRGDYIHVEVYDEYGKLLNCSKYRKDTAV